jgi:hypothetical protein
MQYLNRCVNTYVVPAAPIAKTLEGGIKPPIVNKNLQAKKWQTMHKPAKLPKSKNRCERALLY